MLHCHSSTMIFTCNICMYMTVYLFIVAICLPLYTKCFPLCTKHFPLYKMFPITYKTALTCPLLIWQFSDTSAEVSCDVQTSRKTGPSHTEHLVLRTVAKWHSIVPNDEPIYKFK